MKKFWYDEIFSIINKVLLIKIPFEIVHFPETGVHSALAFMPVFLDWIRNFKLNVSIITSLNTL
jgi:hypothetical protein